MLSYLSQVRHSTKAAAPEKTASTMYQEREVAPPTDLFKEQLADEVGQDARKHAEHIRMMLDQSIRQLDETEHQLNALVYSAPGVSQALDGVSKARRNVEAARSEIRVLRALVTVK
jgi:hypothetical protein